MNIIKKIIDVLIGLQWGDEGKGKLILWLLENGDYAAVVRFNGAHNAGHSLKIGDTEIVAHILPSGGLIPGKELWLGGNVLVNHTQMLKEMNELKEVGFDVSKRIFIDYRAILASPFDTFIDAAEECFKSRSGSKVGTTGRGIAQGYGFDTTRNGLRYGNILKPDFTEKCQQHFEYQKRLLQTFYPFYGYTVSQEELDNAEKIWHSNMKKVKPSWICNLTERAWSVSEKGKKILAEGAQAYMLDRVLGDYPNVTSSNTIPVALCISLGLPHTVIGDVIGVAKPYVTKVGEGFFPSEMPEKQQEIWRKAGNEFGASTGRPRRTGGLDMELLCKAVTATGVTKLFFAKADICPEEEISIVTGYTKEYFCLSEIKEEHLIIEKLQGWPNWNPRKGESSIVFDLFISTIDGIIVEKIGRRACKIIGYGTGPDKDDIVIF